MKRKNILLVMIFIPSLMLAAGNFDTVPSGIKFKLGMGYNPNDLTDGKLSPLLFDGVDQNNWRWDHFQRRAN